MSNEGDNQEFDSGDVGDRGLEDLLGAFMGASGNAGGGEPPGSMDLGSLMGALGSDTSGGAPMGGGSGGDVNDLLGSLLGGGAASGSGGGSSDMLGGLLGGLLGGGGSAGGGSAGGMGGLLGGLLGGAGGGAMDSFGGGGGGAMMPFAETLSEKLGISPQMANALVTAALGLIMSKLSQQRSGDRSADGLTMNSLMDADYLRESGVAAQVSQQTGMDEEEAIRGLQEAIGMAGHQVSGSSVAPSKPDASSTPDDTDLKGLLDNWG